MSQTINLQDYRAGQPVGAIDLFNVAGGHVGLDVIAPADVAFAMFRTAVEHGGRCIHLAQLDDSTLIELHVPPDAVETVLATARAAGVTIKARNPSRDLCARALPR
jgi:hypothetical protein